MQVVFSSYLPPSSCAYLVEQVGLRGLPEQQVTQGLGKGGDVAQREQLMLQQEQEHQLLLEGQAAPM